MLCCWFDVVILDRDVMVCQQFERSIQYIQISRNRKSLTNFLFSFDTRLLFLVTAS